MSPKTPQKRRLSGQFSAPYTPVTSKKKNNDNDTINNIKPNEYDTTRAAYEDPLTPDRTPTTNTKKRAAASSILSTDGATSSRSARLKLEALSKECMQPAHTYSQNYNDETPVKPKTPTGLGIREPEIDVDLSLHVAKDPNTPTGNVISREDNEVWKFVHPHDFSGSDEDSDEELQPISKQTLPNPFIESNTIRRPKLINPFQSNQPRTNLNPRKTDYSSKLELYNSRTGTYTVQDLTAREKQIKPKILDFSKVANTPPQQPSGKGEAEENENGDKLEKKYLMKNLNGFMLDIKPKNSLGFEIFKDDE